LCALSGLTILSTRRFVYVKIRADRTLFSGRQLSSNKSFASPKSVLKLGERGMHLGEKCGSEYVRSDAKKLSKNSRRDDELSYPLI
jgi:hypothetical protein